MLHRTNTKNSNTICGKALLTTSIALLLTTMTGCGSSSSDPLVVETTNEATTSLIAPLDADSKAWFDAGSVKVAENEAAVEKIVTDAQNQAVAEKGKAKNIILFIGDGMGVSTVTAARILDGQTGENKGKPGEENFLSFEKMPYAGLIKTYNTNQQTPDSAGTATAMMTGVKTKAGMLGVSDQANRATCHGVHSQQGTELVTALELASLAGKSTGIVTTARLTHATPAASYAKTSERNWESDESESFTKEAKTNGCADIATQFVNSPFINVAFGGGRRHFIPATVTDLEGKTGKRKDKQDLTKIWQEKNSDGVYVEDEKGFNAIPADATKVLGLFNSSHMQYEADRKNDVAGEPSLTEMTVKAIDLLSKNENGYFMMVEAGRIDHGHHAGSAYNALTDTVEFANAVKEAMSKTSPEDTLIIVTADHSHVMNMAGYPTRGNPILGKVVGNDDHGEPKTEPELAFDEKPYTTLSYANGLGFEDLGDETDGDKAYDKSATSGREGHDLAHIDTTKPGYHQEALVPMEGGETHAAEDVGIYARGPGASLVTSTSEQNEIFHIMNYAGNLLDLAEAKQKP